jgi:hypothetical protein
MPVANPFATFGSWQISPNVSGAPALLKSTEHLPKRVVACQMSLVRHLKNIQK